MLRQYCIESKTQEEYDMVVAECTKALRSTQEIILTSQTFLNVPLIAFAVFTSFMMTLLSFFVVLHKQHPRISASQSTLRSEDNHRGNITAILRELFKENLVNTSLSLLFLLQMAMFFASSLIEEEHDVQYFFFTSALFAMVAREVYDLLCLRRSCVFKRSYLGLADEKEPSAFSNWKWQDSRMRLIMLIVLLIVHRFCRTLTEGMRRRWLFEKQNTEVAAMEQRYDLAWIIYTHITSIGSVFAADISQILKDSILLCFFANSFASIALALFFGILMRNGFSKRSVVPRRSLSTGLLLLAFVLIALNNAGDTRLCGHYMCYGIYGLCVIQLVICRSFGMAILQWMALIIRPCLFPLIPFEMAIGFLLRLLDIHPLVVWFGVTSAFFYAGNSNSLSTVDISVGYVCVQSYQPVIIALQLLLNTYAGPFTLLIAWKSAALLCKSNMVSKHFEIDEKVGICVYSNFKRAAFGYCEGTRNLGDDVKESFKNEPLDVKKHGEGCACKKCGCASASEADGIEIALITHFVLVIFSRMSSCLLSLLIQRHHLFVWSVFAPKFLYECVHLIMVSLYVIYRFMSVVFLEFSAGRE
ncbi:GPI ethanolamine phosphate transferase 2 [Toxocara canis]|uniref:GPI ethanolamine phosphate transferase 2 n=1 Tax=Toxocara canis TaxID=6265 RepID=A0A0B2V857_TOXCA|nr:GPI ethanolamine phosphate transferase 2 [Toxocara canis]